MVAFICSCTYNSVAVTLEASNDDLLVSFAIKVRLVILIATEKGINNCDFRDMKTDQSSKRRHSGNVHKIFKVWSILLSYQSLQLLQIH